MSFCSLVPEGSRDFPRISRHYLCHVQKIRFSFDSEFYKSLSHLIHPSGSLSVSDFFLRAIYRFSMFFCRYWAPKNTFRRWEKWLLSCIIDIHKTIYFVLFEFINLHTVYTFIRHMHICMLKSFFTHFSKTTWVTSPDWSQLRVFSRFLYSVVSK